MTIRTIRIILGAVAGLVFGIAAYVIVVLGFCDALGLELGTPEWWVPALTIGIPLVAGLVIGAKDDEWSVWAILPVTIGAALIACVILLVILIVGMIWFAITNAPLGGIVALLVLFAAIAAPTSIIIIFFSD